MQLPITLISVLILCYNAALAQAQGSCSTVTTEVIVPTSTYTFLSTSTWTTQATTPKDLGTFTWVTVVSTTSTIKTITSVSTDCTATGITQTHLPTTTIYTTQPTAAEPARRNIERQAEGCTVTVASTTTYGDTYTWIPANKTTTYTDYTAYSQTTETSTRYGGKAWAISTVYTTTCTACGPTITATAASTTATTSQDARCAPSAMVSAAGGYNGSVGFGLLYMDDVPYGGAKFTTTAQDASSCCQLCVDESGCAASAWDVRTGQCRLEFSADWGTGAIDCGEGALVFYDYGPDQPMEPGTGWYIATVCGRVSYAGAKPDDGS